MTQSLLFSQSALVRMVRIETTRAQFFQNLADDRQNCIPVWLKFIQRVGIGRNFFYAKLSAHAKYQLTAAAMVEFQRCVVKWSDANVDAKDHEVQLLLRLFSKVEIFSDGKFDVNKETLSLYNAAVLDVAKFFVLEAQVINEVLRKNSVGTRVERNDIINVLKEHWQEFRMPKKLPVTI